MNILIAGGSGFVGQELIRVLSKKHNITVLGRSEQKLKALFPRDIYCISWENLDKVNPKNFEIIINLSGSNIGARRWSTEIKRNLIDSRVDTTTSLINWASAGGAKPHFYCANAIGIYGLQTNGDKEVFTESSPIDYDNPRDFLSEIGIRWQKAAESATEYGMKVTITRFAVVLKKGQGMLKKLSPSYSLGLGSIIGDGQQILSWIDVDDLTHAYEFLLDHPEIEGVVNLCAPNPVEQKQFAKTLAKTMGRPLLFKTPEFIIRLLFGEMGDTLINHGQNVIGQRLLENGFQFQYPTLSQSLQHQFKKQD